MIKNVLVLTTGLVLTLTFLIGCKCGSKASFATVEQARNQARANGEKNAKLFRMKNQKFSDYEIYERGDSTISSECPMGDGWTTVDLIHPKTGAKVKLKCSSFSQSIGCILASEFKTKIYAQQDGTCNKEVPHPIPKIGK